MSEHKQSRVSEAVWPWDEAGRGKARPRGPAPGARVRSVVQAAVLAVAGVVLTVGLKLVLPGKIVLVLAGVVLVSGQLVPPVYRAFDLFGRMLGGAVAAVLTWVLLVPFYLLCFVPARFVLVLLGKDPLRRAFPGRERSYWVPHPPAGELKRFKRQY